MTDHTLIIEPDVKYIDLLAKLRPVTDEDRTDLMTWYVTCSNPSACPGWIECDEPHRVGDLSAADGPYDTVCGCCSDDGQCTLPWCGYDEFVFHGVNHEWRSGHGWTVEYEGCPVVGFGEIEPPDECYPLRPSRWLVDPDWEDDHCYLSVIREAKSMRARAVLY